jgi:hypothetical protein
LLSQDLPAARFAWWVAIPPEKNSTVLMVAGRNKDKADEELFATETILAVK